MHRSVKITATLAFLLIVAALATGLLARDYAAYGELWRSSLQRSMHESDWPSLHPEYDSFYNANAYILRQSLAVSAPEILYFNDSTMGAHNSDETQDTLAQLVATATGQSIQGVSAPGLTPVLVKAYTALLAQAPHKPKVAIININPRALTARDFFDPTRYYGNLLHYLTVLTHEPAPGGYLEWCAARLRGLDFTAHLKSLTASGAFPASEEYFAARRKTALQPFKGSCTQDSQEEADLCSLFIDNYMVVIDSQSPMSLVLGDALDMLRRAGITPLVYVTPVNIQEAVSLAGPQFAQRMRDNIAALRRNAASHGVDLLDYSELLGPERFVDRQWACEHLSFEGRRQLAIQLAQAVKALR